MTPLHIPLSSLPVPVPMWTPLDMSFGWTPISLSPGVVPVDPIRVAFICQIGQTVCAAYQRGRDPQTYPIQEEAQLVSVDLSPPPIDANGHPTRIDALPVLVDMLARAMGHPDGQRTLRPSLVCNEWVLRTWTDGGVYHFTRFTLAGTDLTAPNAHRLALAAILAAGVWETP